MYIYLYIFFQILFHYRLLQDIVLLLCSRSLFIPFSFTKERPPHSSLLLLWCVIPCYQNIWLTIQTKGNIQNALPQREKF